MVAQATPAEVCPELAEFLFHKEGAGLRPRSLKWYGDQLRPVLADLGPKPTREAVLRWLVAWRGRANPQLSYYKAKMVALSAYFKWQGRTLGLKLPSVPRHDGRRLSDREVNLLLGACRGSNHCAIRDRAILSLFLDSGLRVGELVMLRWADVDMEQGKVAIIEGKGGHARSTYFGQVAREALQAWAKESDSGPYLFPGRPGKSHTEVSTIGKIVARHGDAIGLHLTPHDLRRTFATTWIRKGGNVFALQRLLGHQTLAMVGEYVALAEADLALEGGRRGILDTLAEGDATTAAR